MPIIFILCIWCCSFTLGICQTKQDSVPLSFTIEQDIVVTGQSIPTAIESSVLPTTVITKEMIAKRAASNVLEILQQQTSIRIEKDGVLGTFITMNGLDGKHIKILIDGVPMIGRSDGNLDLERIPVQNIERIEIIENAMSVAYGTNAIGGTINIITYKQQTQQWDAAIISQLQSNNTFNNSIALGAQWKDWQVDLYYHYNHFGGYSTDTFRSQTWNPKGQHAVDTKLTYNSKKNLWRSAYQFNYLNETIDDKGNIKLAVVPEMAYAKDYQFLTTAQNHQLTNNGFLSKKKQYYINSTLSFNDFNRQKNGYFQPLKENPETIQLDTLDSDTTSFQAWNFRTSIASNYKGKINFELGTDIRYDYTTGDRIENQFSSIGDYALFGSFHYQPIENLKISAGSRIAYNTLARLPFTYSLGLKWKVMAGMNLRFSYARGIRMPSLKELYLDFVDINHYIKGNPDLQPEYAHNLRLKWNYNKMFQNKHLVKIQANVFYNYIDQQINLFSFDLDEDGNYIPSVTSNEYAYFNLDNFQNWGIGSHVHYQFGGLTIRLGALVTGNYNIAHKEQPESVEPFTYTLEFSQEVSYHFKKIDLNISLFRRDYDQLIRYTIETSPITQEAEIVQGSIAGYGLMDLTLSKSFLNKGIQLSGGIKNLLDVQNIAQSTATATHSGGGGNLPIAMGRIFFVRLMVQPFAFHKQ